MFSVPLPSPKHESATLPGTHVWCILEDCIKQTHKQKHTNTRASKGLRQSVVTDVSLTQVTVKKATHLLAITDLFVDLSDFVLLKAVLAYSFRVHVTKLRQRNSLFWTFTAEHLTTRSENTKNDSTSDFIKVKASIQDEEIWQKVWKKRYLSVLIAISNLIRFLPAFVVAWHCKLATDSKEELNQGPPDDKKRRCPLNDENNSSICT